MKAKLAVVLGVLAATVLLVVLMTISPDQPPAPAPERTAPKPPQPGVAAMPTEPQSPAAEPAPLAGEEDLAAIEARIESSVDRLPLWERLRLWRHYPRPQMSDEDYENARELYLRFLDNFVRIETARFHVEAYEVTSDGEVSTSEDVVWSSSKWSSPRYRVEGMSNRNGETRRFVTISDGATICSWPEEHVGDREHVTHLRRHRGTPCVYFWSYQVSMLRERRPYFLNDYTNCDIDDGTTGYSRVWNRSGREAQFDTATGLVTEYGLEGGGSIRNTYQQVEGLWFPRETVAARGFLVAMGCGVW